MKSVTLAALLLAGLLAACSKVEAPKRIEATPGPAPALAALPARPLTPAWPPAAEASPDLADDLFARNYYVVLDGSGSMNQQGCSGAATKMQAAREALATFSASVPPHANLGLEVFDAQGITERLKLGTQNRDQFTRLVNNVRANGGTPLRSAIERAYMRLIEQGRRQLGYGEYHLVIVTDGAADQGQDPTQVVNRILTESPVVVQTIGFCIGTNHSLNQPGRTIYRAADNVAELNQGLADVLAEAPQFAVTQFK